VYDETVRRKREKQSLPGKKKSSDKLNSKGNWRSEKLKSKERKLRERGLF